MANTAPDAALFLRNELEDSGSGERDAEGRMTVVTVMGVSPDMVVIKEVTSDEEGVPGNVEIDKETDEGEEAADTDETGSKEVEETGEEEDREEEILVVRDGVDTTLEVLALAGGAEGIIVIVVCVIEILEGIGSGGSDSWEEGCDCVGVLRPTSLVPRILDPGSRTCLFPTLPWRRAGVWPRRWFDIS